MTNPGIISPTTINTIKIDYRGNKIIYTICNKKCISNNNNNSFKDFKRIPLCPSGLASAQSHASGRQNLNIKIYNYIRIHKIATQCL